MWSIISLKSRVYADYAAATPVHKQVLKAMRPYWRNIFVNPNAGYHRARQVKNLLNDCEVTVRRLAHMHKDDKVMWTSGGTEANHRAIDYAIKRWKELHPGETYTIIISNIEHPSVADFVESIRDPLCFVEYIDVDGEGVIKLKDLGARLPSVNNLILVSCIFQSSEVGSTQPIKELAQLVRKHKGGREFPYIHTDASQGLYYHKLNFRDWGIDMCTICGQKIEGPKGSGALLARENIEIDRPGTPAVPLIIGITKALELAQSQISESNARIRELRTLLFDTLDRYQIAYSVNGVKNAQSLLVNLSFPFCTSDSEALIVAMDERGVELSSKSACVGSQKEDSRILQAMGIDTVPNSLRISLHHSMKKTDIRRIAYVLAQVVRTKK
ncbi:MAG: cysteine desulfurase family protein [Patescibacteria group bacterium]